MKYSAFNIIPVAGMMLLFFRNFERTRKDPLIVYKQMNNKEQSVSEK